ncbi:MAG: type II secretion system F family protein [Patescibacteria group bacterium]|nr:type II secretion system F family protein [Patescibacteria group bacterium]
MLDYTYTAKNHEGDIVKGDVEAENDLAAARLLTAKNLTPIDILPKKAKKSFDFLNRVTTKDKALFARQLATMINAGLPISQALTTLSEQTANQKLKGIIETVGRDIEGGATLSASFSQFPKVFKETELSLIASGEASGSLDKVLLKLAGQIEKDYSINKRIRSAFTYPAFIVVVIAGVLVIMTIYVMPKMEELYADFKSQLPFLTRIVLGFSHIISRYGILVLLALIGFASILRIYIRKPQGRKMWDTLKLRTPIFGNFFQKVYITRFASTLSSLVSSGVPLLDSLRIVSDAIGNVVIANVIKDAAEKVKGGIPLSTPIKESGEFPLLVSQMISVGEKTGELDGMLENLANFYSEEVDNMVRNFSALLEPVIIVIMGIVIGILLVAIMMPIYGLSTVLFK